jgi:hypothetical protein
MHKRIGTLRGLKYAKYASVNKRVRSLEESGYVEKTGVKKTRAGFESSIYELSAKAYLAMFLDSISLENLLAKVNETTASAILGALASAIKSVSDE